MSSDTILKGDHIRTIPPRFGPDWPNSFREEDFLINILLNLLFLVTAAILVLRPGSSNTILKGNHLRPIRPKFGPKWPSSFRGDDFYLIFFVYILFVVTVDILVGYRSGSLDTFLKGNHQRTIPPKFGSIWPSAFRGVD